jgi:FemAB-related protein (PEP-CTERM system-associated)
MPEVQVRLLEPTESADWPEPLVRAAGFVARDSWSRFVWEAYRIPAYRLEASEAGRVAGVLSLSHVTHPLFGNYLSTAPFASYGGLAFDSLAARDALLAGAAAQARARAASYTVVRFSGDEQAPPNGWVQQPIYATYLLELPPAPDALLASFSSDHRSHVRRGLKKGFSVRFGGRELLDEAYSVIARSMHELGSPYHPRSYLRAMLEWMADDLEFAVVYDARGRTAGAGAFISDGRVSTNLHANILRRYRRDYAGEFLYWSAILRCYERGLQAFDMGRSLIGSGNEAFKMKWKPRRRLLSYWYNLEPGAHLPGLNQKNPKFRLAIWAWKRLPFAIAQALGPSMIRGLV